MQDRAQREGDEEPNTHRVWSIPGTEASTEAVSEIQESGVGESKIGRNLVT